MREGNFFRNAEWVAMTQRTQQSDPLAEIVESQQEEIQRYKWIESEKAGADIGFEKALLDWIVKYRSSWRNKRAKGARTEPNVA